MINSQLQHFHSLPGSLEPGINLLHNYRCPRPHSTRIPGGAGTLGIRIFDSFPAVAIGQPELKSLALCKLL